MRMNEYQAQAIITAIYPEREAITYPALGLVGEAGEFCNKHKKTLRDGREFTQEDKMGELGDILWYLAALANDCDLTLEEIAEYNINKLQSRQQRGVLGGSGDNR